MKFRSKVDIWLRILIITVAAMVFKAAYLIASQPNGFIEAFLLVLMGAALPVWILLATSYDVINDNLRIYSGPFRWKIHILSIFKIEPTRSWVSSPALSLNRIRIEYGQGKVILVSPVETDKFLRAIRDSMNCRSHH